MYTSHGIHDEILKILGNKVVHTICERVKEAGFYSIIADESRDSAKQEQLSFCIRYVDMTDNCVHEHFLTFLQAENLGALSLSSYIKQLVSTYDFDPYKMVSQGYDGASVMSGRCTGVQARVQEFAPFAAYIHCYAHVLNLVLVDSVKSVSCASEFFTLLEAFYVFVSSSKIHVLFMKKQHEINPNKQPLELQKLSDTRWVCRYAAVHAVCCTFDSLLLTVQEVADSSVGEYTQAVEARGLYHQIKSFSFLVALITFDRILTCTKQLSDNLQSSSIDLSRASELVLATKSLLTEYRSDSYWEKVYNHATRVAELHDITVEVTTRRRKRIPARFNDSIVCESTGLRVSPSAKEEFKTHFYFPVLDQFLQEFNNRFGNQNSTILKGISACSPKVSNFLCLQDLESFSEMYNVPAASHSSQLEVEVHLITHLNRLNSTATFESLVDFRRYLYSCQQAYETLFQLTQIALTIVVTSAESERSFSTLKRIKTRLRSRMVEERLTALTKETQQRKLISMKLLMNLPLRKRIEESFCTD